MTPAQAVTDAQILIGDATQGTGLIGAYTQFKAVNPTVVSAAVDQKVQVDYTEAKALLAQVQGTASAVAQSQTLAQVLQHGQAIVTVLIPFAVSDPPLALALEAANVLIPVVQAEIAANAPAAPVVTARARKAKARMTTKQARAVLS